MLVLALSWPSFVHASYQEEDTYSEDALFSSEEAIEITISANFKKLLNDRGEDRGYHKAKISYLLDQDTVIRSAKLKTRGNFRRDPANCKYPPIKVKFGKPNPDDFLFASQDKLKLVIQCQIEKYVLLEYLAYRIYNVMTDSSYRVRLAHITYVDKDTKEVYATKYGFFIESIDQLAHRIGVEEYKKNAVQYFVERKHMVSLAVFQYLIGNDDWYVASAHNISVFKDDAGGDLLAVPYDFDWSKLVDASYTKPEGVPNNLLRNRRVYKGLCMTPQEFNAQQRIFNDKEEDIRSLVNSVPNLSTRDRKRALNYIDQFYKILNKPSSLTTIFQKEKCIEEQNVPGRKKPD